MSESERVKAFTEFRQRMNDRILGQDNQVIRRFFALDTQTYKEGVLELKTKELMGLVASMVLRCDDSTAMSFSRRFRWLWWSAVRS
jgi:alkylhydroperoxidase/carboxymuconolactone decarboxylase family protein YurZ